VLSPTAGLTGLKGERLPSACAASGSEKVTCVDSSLKREAAPEGDVLLTGASSEWGENARRGEAGLGLASHTCTAKSTMQKARTTQCN